MKPAFIALIGILLIVSGCSQQQGQDANVNAGINVNANGANNTGANNATNANAGGQAMTIANGDIVKVEYVGKFTDGNIFDQSAGRGPLEFTAGAGQMIKGFDEAIIGMKLNDEKTVTIPPEKAYGTADSGERVAVPLSSIQQGDGNVAVGTKLYTGSGQQLTVIDINGANVTLEAKHPLAGKTLVFWIKVVDIKKPA